MTTSICDFNYVHICHSVQATYFWKFCRDITGLSPHARGLHVHCASPGADTQVGRGKKDFTQEPEKSHYQEEHCQYEEQCDRYGDVELDKRAREEQGDDAADQQCRHRAAGDGQVYELGPAREDAEMGSYAGRVFRRGILQPALQEPGPVNDPTLPQLKGAAQVTINMLSPEFSCR